MLAKVPVEDLIAQRCSPDEMAALIEYVKQRRDIGITPGFGILLPPDLAERFAGKEAWMRIRKFCAERFSDVIYFPTFLLDSLYRIYTPENAGAWVGDGVLCEREKHLEFDADGLLIGPREHLRFAKDGVLTDQYWILYYRGLPGVGLSDGFVEALTGLERTLEPTRHFGLAVQDDCVLGRDLYLNISTRAFIRGPRSFSADLLRSPRFPESARGTVTIHERLDDNPLYVLFPLIRTEFMWSRRENLKTIQIEELKPARTHMPQVSVNRYLHAIWNCDKECFVHLDGALRTYNSDTLKDRLSADLRSFRGKATSYKKMFRIDSDITIPQWSDLTARFFQDNELVMEYLESSA